MLLKTNLTAEKREAMIGIIGGIAQIALVASIILGRLDLPGLDFLEGMLLGFSMVGNLVYLYHMGQKRRNQ